MVIAVTGASGFIGSHLTEELARRGHRARGISRRARASHDAMPPGAEHVVVDYGDGPALARALAGVDVVIHAAAATRAPTTDELVAANVTVTRQVLDAARDAGTSPRFVMISSQAAAGPAASLDAPTREDDTPAPIEAYGRSKLDAERLVARSDALQWTVVRPASVYGPRDRDFLPLFRLAARGVAMHPANRRSWISIVHVRDCVAGIIAAATTASAVGRCYFLANAAPVQWGTLFERAAAAAGRRLVLDVELPRMLVEMSARLGDVHARLTGRASLLTSEKVALNRAAHWVCSSERAHRELGFAPGVSLEAGIAETYQWYVSQGSVKAGNQRV